MKRLVFFMVIVLLPFIAHAGLPVYYVQVSATDVNSTVTVSLICCADKAKSVVIKNDGSNEIFYTLNGPTATTSDAKLLSGETISFSNLGSFAVTKLGIICSTGETATVRIFAYPQD